MDNDTGCGVGEVAGRETSARLAWRGKRDVRRVKRSKYMGGGLETIWRGSGGLKRCYKKTHSFAERVFLEIRVKRWRLSQNCFVLHYRSHRVRIEGFL